MEIASKVFINNTKKIINNLEEIQELLIESRRIKIKKSKNLEKRKWFIRYKDNIMELINLLQGKGNKNDEEEGDDNMDDENDNQWNYNDNKKENRYSNKIILKKIC